jgi:hypothetical protein
LQAAEYWWQGLTGGNGFRRMSRRDDFNQVLTVWLTHHDILIPGYEESGRIRPREIEGIDLIVNGHVHRALAPVTKGRTHWYTAGNITRRSRSDASRSHVPAVPCLMPVLDDADTADETDFGFTAAGQRWKMQRVTVPHEPFDEVFYPEVICDDSDSGAGSGFVADLRELTARRTDSGAGLHEFLKQHLDQFEPPVAEEILRLAAQVTHE